MPEKRRQYEQEFKEGRFGLFGSLVSRSPRLPAISILTPAPWVIGSRGTAVNVKAPKGFPPTMWPS